MLRRKCSRLGKPQWQQVPMHLCQRLAVEGHLSILQWRYLFLKTTLAGFLADFWSVICENTATETISHTTKHFHPKASWHHTCTSIISSCMRLTLFKLAVFILTAAALLRQSGAVLTHLHTTTTLQATRLHIFTGLCTAINAIIVTLPSHGCM